MTGHQRPKGIQAQGFSSDDQELELNDNNLFKSAVGGQKAPIT